MPRHVINDDTTDRSRNLLLQEKVCTLTLNLKLEKTQSPLYNGTKTQLSESINANRTRNLGKLVILKTLVQTMGGLK